MRTTVTALLALLAGLALIGAGCGGSEKDEESPATPAEAIAQIGAVRKLLDSALVKYRAGDADAAEQLVGDAYLEHFEHVEGPLEDEDAELSEDLEETISTEIRDKIKAGAPVDDVAELVEHAKTHLDEAERVLEKA